MFFEITSRRKKKFPKNYNSETISFFCHLSKGTYHETRIPILTTKKPKAQK